MDALLEHTFRAEQQHFWYRGFRRFVTPLIDEATRGLSRPRMLDAGCGTGANLRLLAPYGVAFGVELFWRGLEFARHSGLTRLTRGSVTQLPYATGTMDLIVSFDVLYCLHPPEEAMALAEMHRVLRSNGAVIINVAAMDVLKGDHSALGGEVHRYTRRELQSKLTAAGFDVVRITYTNAALFPLMLTVRTYQRLRGVPESGQGGGDFYVPPAPINALFAGALALEARAVHAGIDMPAGSSLLCLARKR